MFGEREKRTSYQFSFPLARPPRRTPVRRVFLDRCHEGHSHRAREAPRRRRLRRRPRVVVSSRGLLRRCPCRLHHLGLLHRPGRRHLPPCPPLGRRGERRHRHLERRHPERLRGHGGVFEWDPRRSSRERPPNRRGGWGQREVRGILHHGWLLQRRVWQRWERGWLFEHCRQRHEGRCCWRWRRRRNALCSSPHCQVEHPPLRRHGRGGRLRDRPWGLHPQHLHVGLHVQ
jgi:hypothetical protein